MSENIITKGPYFVVGRSLQTSNNPEGLQKIVGHWGKIYEDNLFEKIQNRAPSGTVFGVYHSYESDKNGAYTLTVGPRVKDLSDAPSFLDKLEIPVGKYVTFVAENPDKVYETWQKIWASDLNRAYTYDFEMYGSEKTSQRVYIHIAVK